VSAAETVICTFRVKSDEMATFRGLLDRHWPTLRRLELVTDTAEQVFIGEDDGVSGPVVVSIFEWANPEAVDIAHEHPDVAEIWEAMEPVCEPRGGRPSMEFPHFQRVAVQR
jgi:hypothetical protein